MSKPLMKCGHVANAKDKEGKDVCVICVGIDPGATEVKDPNPKFEGRKAICATCGHETESRPELAFFEYRPLVINDLYYCGCRGWD